MRFHIKNKEEFERKIEALRDSGVDNLHVIADFDKTLTKAKVEGQKTHSSIAQLREGGYLTEDYPAKAFALFDKFHPYETSLEHSQKVKNQKMQEWWERHLQLMIESGVTKEVIEDIVNKKSIVLRDNIHELFSLVRDYEVPFLVFSAGLGDIIEGVLADEGLLYGNVNVIANYYEFRDDGRAVGYKSRIVHCFNKSEVQLDKLPYGQEVAARKNVVLLGDSLGDVDMAQGVEHDVVFRIGFLNKDEDELLDTYMDSFDVVLTGDSSLEYVVELMRKIVQK